MTAYLSDDDLCRDLHRLAERAASRGVSCQPLLRAHRRGHMQRRATAFASLSLVGAGTIAGALVMPGQGQHPSVSLRLGAIPTASGSPSLADCQPTYDSSPTRPPAFGPRPGPVTVAEAPNPSVNDAIVATAPGGIQAVCTDPTSGPQFGAVDGSAIIVGTFNTTPADDHSYQQIRTDLAGTFAQRGTHTVTLPTGSTVAAIAVDNGANAYLISPRYVVVLSAPALRDGSPPLTADQVADWATRIDAALHGESTGSR